MNTQHRFLTVISLAIILNGATLSAQSALPSAAADTAEQSKTAVYGDVSIGFGRTLFFGRLADEQRVRESRGFSASSGFNFAAYFYVPITSVRGLGIGGGVKGFAASPASGGDNEQYFFNYYHVGASAKYYFLTQKFNEGLFVKANFGFGQMTEKTRFNNTKTYDHQFAIGTAAVIGLGYSYPIAGKTALNVFGEYEYGSRNGDVSGEGEGITFQNGQLSLNFGISF